MTKSNAVTPEMTSDVLATYRREVARIELGKVLATKVRGDRISAAEIQTATGIANWRSFGNTIERWCRQHGLAKEAVTNDGWRFVSAAEQLDYQQKKAKSALRQEKRGLQAAASAPEDALTEGEVRKRNFLVGHAARRVEQAERDSAEVKHELKLTERNPLRALK